MTDQESALLPGPVNRPHHDSIRRRGVDFTHAFCNTPQCSPARAALLTGLEPHQAGVLSNVDRTSLGKPLSSRLPTLGTLCRTAGYATAYFGKWHLGNDTLESLQPFGFAEYRPGADSVAAQSAAAWIDKQEIEKQPVPWLAWISVLNPHNIYNFIDRRLSIQPRPGVRAPATSRADLAGKPPAQQQFLDRDQGRPTLAYTAKDWLRYRSFYCELVEKADTCLGTVLSSLKNLDNTIVVCTSDHGDALGEHGLPFKGPFMYEPLIRIPLVISAPGLQPGARRNDFVTSADIAPTVAGLAGLPWPRPISGKDVSSHSSGRDAVFLEYYGKQHSVTPIRTIRTAHWKLNQYRDGPAELYDLQNDPAEARNLSGSPAVARLQAELGRRLEKWWPA